MFLGDRVALKLQQKTTEYYPARAVALGIKLKML